MLKNYSLEDYSEIYEKFNDSIKSKEDYNRTAVALEYDMESKGNQISSNVLFISILFAYIITSTFDNILNFMIEARDINAWGRFISMEVVLVFLLFVIIHDYSKENKKKMKIKKELLILLQERERLHDKKPYLSEIIKTELEK